MQEARSKQYLLFAIFLAALSGLISSGCSSVPRADTGERGVFQQSSNGQGESHGLPIALAPTGEKHFENGFAWPVQQGRVCSPTKEYG